MHRALPPTIVALALAIACNNDADKKADDGDTPPIASKDDGGKTKRPDPIEDPDPDAPALLPEVDMPPIGAQPGWIADGLLYVAFKAKPTHAFIKGLPWPSEALRESAEAASEIGFDPLRADWIEHFAIADDAVISATILRPIDDAVADAKTRLSKYAPAAGEGGVPTEPPMREERRFEEKKAEAKIEVPIEEPAKPHDEGAIAIPPTTPTPVPVPVPTPPTGSPEATLLRERLASAAYHTRVHIPSKDPSRTREAIVGLFKPRDRTRGTEACRDLTGVVACTAESSAVLMLRQESAAIVADLVVFELSSHEGPPPAWTPVLKLAIAAPTVDVVQASSLGGDAVTWIDPRPLGRLHAMDRIGSAVASAEWTTDWPGTAAEEMGRVQAFAEVFEAPRVFPGVQIEAVAPAGGELHMRATWPVTGPLWGRLGAKMITTPASPSPVPTIAALCEGASICMRAQGIPDVRGLSSSIATKGFAGDFGKVINRLERDEEYTLTLLFAGAWANLLAAASNAPDSMTGGEAGIVRTVRDGLMRSEAYGGSVRSFSLRGFFELESDYVFYTRAQATDVAAAQGLAALSGESTREIEVTGGKGKATMLDTRSSRPRAAVFFQKVEGEAAGWIALADAPDRFSWLRGLPTETTSSPAAYLEFPDLQRFMDSFDTGGSAIAEMRPWMNGKRLRFALELGAGSPRLRAALTSKATP